MTNTEMNLDLGDGMKLSVEIPQDINILQFQSIATKIVKIAKIVERETELVGSIRSGNGKKKYNGGRPRKKSNRNTGFGKKVLAHMRVNKRLSIKDMAKHFGVSGKQITDVMNYNQKKGITERVDRGVWVKVQ